MSNDLNLESLGPADREAMAEIIAELERRQIRWPCYACRLRHLATGDDGYFKSCAHVEHAGITYEGTLREIALDSSAS
jgi:hypothetical protein